MVLLDVNETALTETANRLEKSGTHVITVTGSVAEPETARHTCAEAVRQYGHIDVLINNAGVSSLYPSLELPLEEECGKDSGKKHTDHRIYDQKTIVQLGVAATPFAPHGMMLMIRGAATTNRSSI